MRHQTYILKKNKFSLFGLLSLVLISLVLVEPTQATDKADWRAGNIINDYNFTNKDSLSEQEIQTFLDQEIGNCDIWGAGRAVEYGSNLTRAQYASSRGWSGPPYTCLNRFYEVPKFDPGPNLPVSNYSNPGNIPAGARSAAWIIKDAANRYNISPKVLLVKIATESAGPLTSDSWPLYSQYRYAMGAHCPDSGPGGAANCDLNYAGFSIQMYDAASLLRYYLDNMQQPWWRYKKPYQNNSILWNVVERRCGEANVYIENKATAALYTYTPYQPNQAALNNLYGTGDNCSAYGNRNFWRVYFDYFGSPSYSVQGGIGARYNQLGGSRGVLGEPLVNEFTPNNVSWWQQFQNGFIIGTGQTGFWESKGAIRDRWGQLGYQSGTLGYPTSGETFDGKGWWQLYQNGAIVGTIETGFWESKGAIRDRWGQLGYQSGTLGYPTSGETFDGKGWWQLYQNGAIVGTIETGFWESKGAIRDRWGQLGYQSGTLGYPTSGETAQNNYIYQSYENGTIYWGSGKNALGVLKDINSRYKELGGPSSYLGYPVKNQVCDLIQDGCYQDFENGTIMWSPQTGAWETSGAIRTYWSSRGYENSSVGYPINSIKSDSKGWWQSYQNGILIGTSSTGFWEVSGAIRERWIQLGYQNGVMGYPIGPIVLASNGQSAWQKFETGYIITNTISGAWESKGAIREFWAKLGYQSGQAGYPIAQETYNIQTKTWSQRYQNGTISYQDGRGGWFMQN